MRTVNFTQKSFCPNLNALKESIQQNILNDSGIKKTLERKKQQIQQKKRSSGNCQFAMGGNCLDKHILQFRQIHLVIWINTFAIWTTSAIWTNKFAIWTNTERNACKNLQIIWASNVGQHVYMNGKTVISPTIKTLL